MRSSLPISIQNKFLPALVKASTAARGILTRTIKEHPENRKEILDMAAWIGFPVRKRPNGSFR